MLVEALANEEVEVGSLPMLPTHLVVLLQAHDAMEKVDRRACPLLFAARIEHSLHVGDGQERLGMGGWLEAFAKDPLKIRTRLDAPVSAHRDMYTCV